MNPTGLTALDYSIVAAYFVAIVLAGFLLSRKAAQGISDYFLGGRSIPWWAIGMSGTASNFDMAGTMVIISFFYSVGLQGFWVAMRGGIGLPLGVLMVYMGQWLRRSNVMTTAEWMEFRFGRGRQGQTARLFSALSNIVVTMAFLVYFVKGSGKFLAIYLPFSPEVCAMLMIAIAIVYTSLSGFYGVIYTDVLQEVLILSVSIFVACKAFLLPNHAELMRDVGAAWSSFVPRVTAEPMEWLDDPLVYQAFGVCVMFWILRGVLEGVGGFTGGYMTQRYYAARNDREASLLTAEWILLTLFRWGLIIGCVLLGLALAHGSPEVADALRADPENTLPVVLSQAIPAGMRGMMVAGLLAAAMSTFDSTINAGVSYWIRDVYQAHLNRAATPRQLIRQSYLATVAFAVIAVLIGLSVANINDVWSWITGSLSAGLFAPIILRWYWWRFGGYAFAVSTAVGLAASLALRILFPQMPFYLSFVYAGGASLAAGVGGAFLFAPAEREVLEAFWLRIQPFGLWQPVRARLDASRVESARRRNTRDVFNVAAAIGWHMMGVVAVISLLLHKWWTLAMAVGLFASLSCLLYFTWFLKLPSKQEGRREAEAGLEDVGLEKL